MRALPAELVPLVLVQHAHQHMVSNGYDNREGIVELYRALSALLHAHLARSVPLALHVSGTLTEAAAWHVPEFTAAVRRLHDEGLLELVGSSYAQNVMPLFSPQHNRRQLVESLQLYERHYGVSPEEIRTLWVPERVWDTEVLGPVVTDPSLPNGGYRVVLLDDRHAYPVLPEQGMSRADFDRASAPAAADRGENACLLPVAGDGRHLAGYRMAGTGLVVLSLSSDLRYALPAREAEQWHHLRKLVAAARAQEPDALLVYGDDAERCAGVGPWGPRPWQPAALAAYCATLDGLADVGLKPVLPTRWLAGHPVAAVRAVDPGGFYELVESTGAGEDYRGFWEHPEWARYRAGLESVELLVSGTPDSPGGLGDSAWKQLMVSAYETGWQERDLDGVARPTPWARAVAAHARDARLLVAAANAAARSCPGFSAVEFGDLDEDGEDEVVLRNDATYVVVTPRYGGRVVLACDLTVPGGRVVIGNHADDWNWQEQSHQFMQYPRNHPGALADVGHENDRHRVAALAVDFDGALLVLENVQDGSPLRGLRKTLRLRPDAAALDVAYTLPPGVTRLMVEFAFSPDYLTLLREGRGALRPLRDDGAGLRGFAAGESAGWVAASPDQPVLWDRPVQPECGHAGVVAVLAYGAFRLALGTGLPVAAEDLVAEPVRLEIVAGGSR